MNYLEEYENTNTQNVFTSDDWNCGTNSVSEGREDPHGKTEAAEVSGPVTETRYHGCTHTSVSVLPSTRVEGLNTFCGRYCSFERWSLAFIFVLGWGMRYNTKFLIMIHFINLDNFSSNSLSESWPCHSASIKMDKFPFVLNCQTEREHIIGLKWLPSPPAGE